MGLKYKHSSKTKAQWEALNPVIVENEIVIENDTNALKIGNGIDSYSDLKYVTNFYSRTGEIEISLEDDDVNNQREVGVIERMKLTLKRKVDNAVVASIESNVQFDDTICISYTELTPNPVKIEYVVKCTLYRKPTNTITHRVYVDEVNIYGATGVISGSDFELRLNTL